jgi:hypothetical protein
MAANGGIITVEDLAQYRAMERAPLAGKYRGHTVYSPPPPVSTGLQLVETLQILENYKPKAGATYTTDADYFHHAIEAWRVRDGGAQIADPERWPINLGNHLDPAHARERFKLIDPKKVYIAPQGGRGRGAGPGPGPAQFAYEALDAAVADGVAGDGIQTGTTSRRQHGRDHADPVDVGRQLLRVEGARISLQRSLPRRPRRHGLRIDAAADAVVIHERADDRLCP